MTFPWMLKNPSQVLRRAALAILIAWLFSVVASAQDHAAVVLLDVSGSMEREHGILFQRYSRGFSAGTSQMQSLSQRLGAALDARCHCPVYLLPFSSSAEPYAESGPLRGNQLSAHVPDTARGRETELDYALKKGLGHGADTLVFIITDNKNEFGGSTSDAAFYTSLAQDPNINSVYFVPLAEPGSTQDALVLYAVASGRASRDVLRSVAEDFATSVKSEAVQFRPLYEQEKGRPQLGFSQHISQVTSDGDERDANMEGDSVVVPYDEGRPLDGGIKFKLHSNLRHWRIADGQLRQVKVAGEVPAEFQGSGSFQMPVTLSGPKKLNVNPGGDSTEVYTLPLNDIEDAGVVLRRSRLFQTDLPDIHMRVQLNAIITLAQSPEGAGLRPAFSESLEKRIRAVAHLDEIMNTMTFQNDASSANGAMERSIPVSRELILRVHPDGVKNLLARGIMFGGPLLLLAAIIAGFLALRSHVFTLIDPSARPRTLVFSLTKRSAPLQWNGRTVGKLNRSGRYFEIVADRGYKAEPSRLQQVPGRFQLTNTATGDSGQFQLRPGAAQTKTASHGGPS